MAGYAPGRGGGYVVRNDKPPREGQDEAPYLTGKLTVVCPVSQVATEYWLDCYMRKKPDGKTIFKARLKAAKPKPQGQAQATAAQPGRPQAQTNRPAATGSRPAAMANRPMAQSARPGDGQGGRVR